MAENVLNNDVLHRNKPQKAADLVQSALPILLDLSRADEGFDLNKVNRSSPKDILSLYFKVSDKKELGANSANVFLEFLNTMSLHPAMRSDYSAGEKEVVWQTVAAFLKKVKELEIWQERLRGKDASVTSSRGNLELWKWKKSLLPKDGNKEPTNFSDPFDNDVCLAQAMVSLQTLSTLCGLGLDVKAPETWGKKASLACFAFSRVCTSAEGVLCPTNILHAERLYMHGISGCIRPKDSHGAVFSKSVLDEFEKLKLYQKQEPPPSVAQKLGWGEAACSLLMRKASDLKEKMHSTGLIF